MRADERDSAYLWDMLEAVRGIMEFTRHVGLEEFVAPGRDSEMTRLAVERQLEILGEAARRVSSPFRDAHPQIPWREMVGLRNVISHEYASVDYVAIYRILRDQIPELLALLEPLVPPAPPMEE